MAQFSVRISDKLKKMLDLLQQTTGESRNSLVSGYLRRGMFQEFKELQELGVIDQKALNEILKIEEKDEDEED